MGGGGGGAGNLIADFLTAPVRGIETGIDAVKGAMPDGGKSIGDNPLKVGRREAGRSIGQSISDATGETEVRKKAGEAEAAGRKQLADAQQEQADSETRQSKSSEAAAARRRQRAQRASAQGRSGTILTSPLGETTAPTSGQKTLLGG